MGGVVSIREVFSGPTGPENKALQFSSQARHHFTQADQVNLLVSASEADPDLGFMARMLVLCSLPRTNPGNRLQYKRQNGPFTLYMVAGAVCGSPGRRLVSRLQATASQLTGHDCGAGLDGVDSLHVGFERILCQDDEVRQQAGLYGADFFFQSELRSAVDGIGRQRLLQ